MGELFEPTGVLSGAGQVVGDKSSHPYRTSQGQRHRTDSPDGLQPACLQEDTGQSPGGGVGGAAAPCFLVHSEWSAGSWGKLSGARELVCKPRVRLPAWSGTPHPSSLLSRSQGRVLGVPAPPRSGPGWAFEGLRCRQATFRGLPFPQRRPRGRSQRSRGVERGRGYLLGRSDPGPGPAAL